MRKQNPSRNHHYVPRFLLSPWEHVEKGQVGITGYYWRDDRLTTLHRGQKYFCQRPDLFTLKAEVDRPDVVETEFFAKLDDAGSKAISKIKGGRVLTETELADLAVLVLSLDTRRPCYIAALRGEATDRYISAVDRDPTMHSAATAQGLSATEFYERLMGHPLEDRFLLTVLRTTIGEKAVTELLGASWAILDLPPAAPRLLISDRPVIRDPSRKTGAMMWALPIAPKAVLVGANDRSDLEDLAHVAPEILVRLLNNGAVAQCDRFVFGMPGVDRDLLSDAMKARAASDYPDLSIQLIGDTFAAQRRATATPDMSHA